MPLEKQMKSGLLYCEFGHESKEDKAYEKMLEEQRLRCKEVLFDYNQARPSDIETKDKLLRGILGSAGDNMWMESPVHFAYGCNTHIGKGFYSNFNLCVVDDGEVSIGDYVMCGPNVTITVTGHPVWGEYRRQGTQFSLPICIGNDVWIGANAVILPGVTVGDDVVIGAGSVVTRDIPSHTVALGVPCRVVRQITQEDRNYYRKGMPVNEGWER